VLFSEEQREALNSSSDSRLATVTAAKRAYQTNDHYRFHALLLPEGVRMTPRTFVRYRSVLVVGIERGHIRIYGRNPPSTLG